MTGSPQIIGVMLVRNEDRFVRQAVLNTIGFCDRFLAFDHASQDRTPEILNQLHDVFGDKFEPTSIRESGESHRAIAHYADTNTWIFAVDGDEIYDPAGLVRLRSRIMKGEFAGWWCIFGNVLNVTRLDAGTGLAAGHLAPPCRSMTKLYNFAAITGWTGKIVERLHGGEIAFHSGFDATRRCNLHEAASWEDSDFRCLHLCFLPRSSLDPADAAPRKNIMDRHSWTARKLLARVSGMVTGRPAPDWKQEKYKRGPEVTLPVGEFFRDVS